MEQRKEIGIHSFSVWKSMGKWSIYVRQWSSNQEIILSLNFSRTIWNYKTNIDSKSCMTCTVSITTVFLPDRFWKNYIAFLDGIKLPTRRTSNDFKHQRKFKMKKKKSIIINSDKFKPKTLAFTFSSFKEKIHRDLQEVSNDTKIQILDCWDSHCTSFYLVID